MTPSPAPTGLALIDALAESEEPTIEAYCEAAAEYIREATTVVAGTAKSAQLRLSAGLSRATVTGLRARGLGMEHAVAGERTVGGGLRSARAYVSEISRAFAILWALRDFVGCGVAGTGGVIMSREGRGLRSWLCW